MSEPTKLSELHRSRIKLWVDALRSGKYRQGRGDLRSRDGYCCLGVGCCVYHSATNQGQWTGISDRFIDGGGHDSGSMFPEGVAAWFGFDGEHKTNPLIGGSITCTYANDGERMTFPQIADLIERTYLQ